MMMLGLEAAGNFRLIWGAFRPGGFGGAVQ